MGAAVGKVGPLLARLRHVPPRSAQGTLKIGTIIAGEQEDGGEFPPPLPPAVQVPAGAAMGIRPSAESIFESLHGHTVVSVARQSVPGEKAVSRIMPVKTSWPVTQW